MKKSLIVLLFIFTAVFAYKSSEEYIRQRMNMINSIQHWRTPIKDPAVIHALKVVPREYYAPPHLRYLAYRPTVIPIGYGQTLTDMYFVALMTQILEVKPTDKCLEIGTGSGYQASILSQITKKTVYSIEIVPQLSKQATKRIQELGYNVKTKIGDGYFGWKEYAPFDKIIVTCAIDHIPPPLLQQLNKGGIMVIPVGNPFARQKLLKVTKDRKGRIRTENVLRYRDVKFVPFTGKALEKYKK